MRVFLIIVLLVAAVPGYFAFPFLFPVKPTDVESRADAMCTRVLQANSIAQLYPVPDFVNCSCYANALATNLSPDEGAAFLDKKRLEAIEFAKKYAGVGGSLPVNSPEDQKIFSDMFRACLPERLRTQTGAG